MRDREFLGLWVFVMPIQTDRIGFPTNDTFLTTLLLHEPVAFFISLPFNNRTGSMRIGLAPFFITASNSGASFRIRPIPLSVPLTNFRPTFFGPR